MIAEYPYVFMIGSDLQTPNDWMNSIQEVVNWAGENVKEDDYTGHFESMSKWEMNIQFKNEEDAMAFKMRFGVCVLMLSI